MGKIMFVIGLFSMTFGLHAQALMQEYGCGPSRKFASGWRMDFDITYSGKEISFVYKLDNDHNIKIIVEDGGFLNKFRFIQYTHSPLPKGNALPWEHESITQYLSEENDFHYELILRNPDSKSLAQFKSEIKKLLACRYGNIKVVSEGDDFLEYEADGKRFYHGFFLAPKMFSKESHTTDIASFEFIGYSSIENYEARKSTYMKTFHNNRTMLQRYMRDKEITPII